jgi:hypothetical protein
LRVALILLLLHTMSRSVRSPATHRRRRAARLSFIVSRTAVALAAAAVALMAGATPAAASWVDQPPALPAPTGHIVNVSTEAQLQAAITTLTSGTTVMIAPGTYVLTRTLYVKGPLADVVIRGASNRRDDVVLQGRGMTNPDYGAVEFGIWAGGDVQRLTIANLQIRDVYFHPIIMNAGPQSPRLYNIHLVNGGQQLLKTNPADDGSGINNGIIEYSVFEYAPQSRDWYANAIQVLAGSNWIIRNNLIKNIKAPAGEQAGPAVLAWFSASGTIVEGNTFINCQREISFGLIERTPNDHTGGIIRNNFIYRDATVDGDVAIGVFDSPGTKVLNNTIYTAGTYGAAIEYRFPNTTGVVISNNLTNKAITARDGGTATVTGNSTTATLDMFVSPATGDMHLRPTAAAAIDHGSALADVTTDWDGAPRSSGGAVPDLGADEFIPGSSPPSAPTNLRIVP